MDIRNERIKNFHGEKNIKINTKLKFEEPAEILHKNKCSGKTIIPEYFPTGTTYT